MRTLPINIDCGENYGRYRLFGEAPIPRIATLANVACGFHAGDYQSILGTLTLLKNHGIQVGAHPSYPDLQGFGRRYMAMEADDLEACLFYQIASLRGVCESLNQELHHVKAHGALYNVCCNHEKEAVAFVNAVKKVSPKLKILTLPNSLLEQIGREEGLVVMRESFADRAYNSDLSLVSRHERGAVLTDPALVRSQYLDLCRGEVTDIAGHRHEVLSDTICIHGDHPKLGEIADLLQQS